MYKYKPMMDLFVCSVMSFWVLRFSIQQVTSGKLGLLLAATREPDPPLLPSPVVAIEIEWFVFVTRRAGWLSVVKLDASCSRHAPHRHNGLDLFVYQLCDSPQQEVATAMNNFWKKNLQTCPVWPIVLQLSSVFFQGNLQNIPAEFVQNIPFFS